MDKYKILNSAMAIQNQKLHLELVKEKSQKYKLNRELMTTQQIVRMQTYNFANLISQLFKVCTDAKVRLDKEIADLDGSTRDDMQESSDQQKPQSLCRSIQLIQSTRRQDQTLNTLYEELPANNDSRTQFVQTRRRPHNKSSFEVSEEKVQSMQEENQGSYGVMQLADEHTALSTIQEASTRDIQTSTLITLKDSNYVQVSENYLESSDSDESTEMPSTSNQQSSDTQSDIESDSSDSIQEISDSLYDVSLSNTQTKISNEPPSQPATLNHIDIMNRSPVNLTGLHTFDSTSLPSSTPRRNSTRIEPRNCFVKIRKLTPADLIRWGVLRKGSTTDKPGNSFVSKVSFRKKKRTNLSPNTSLIRFSASRMSGATKLGGKRTPVVSKNYSRPRRNAAPVNLREPSLKYKVRRNV